MARVTPPMNSQGLFILRSPFVAKGTVVYHVGAHRNFEDIIAAGIDPLSLVYTPVNLGQAEYDADKLEGATIITLYSATEKPLHVPDTYIESYPNMGVIPHSWLVAAISCGMLPDTYSTSALELALKEVVSDHTGIEGEVFITRAPVTEAITQEQYVQNLNARQAAIKTRTSTYAENIRLAAELENSRESEQRLIELVEQLQERIEELEGLNP